MKGGYGGMVDTKDLKSFAVRRGGSSPSTPKQKHVAILLVNGRMIASSNNVYGSHAETRVIEVAKILGYKGNFLTLISLRVTRAGNLAMAKPCPSCLRAIQGFNISNILYSNPKGVIVKYEDDLEKSH